MIKNIIFDLGGVVIKYDQRKIINTFTNNDDEIKYIFDEIFHSNEWKLMDLGLITKEEVIQNINSRNNNKYKELTEKFLNEWYKSQVINQDVVNIAKKLKENEYNIYVLSNMATTTYEYYKNNDFFKLCNGIVISAHEHIKKPDEKIFNILLDRYSLKAEECLFIDDDDTEKSYNVANSIGILGRKVKSNDSADINKLLKKYSINLL